VPDKAQRVFNFHRSTVAALGELVAAAGLEHPSDLPPHHIVHRISPTEVQLLSAKLPTLAPGDLLGARAGKTGQNVFETWWERASAHSFALQVA